MFAEKFFEKYELKGHQNIHAMRVFPMVTVFYFGYYTKELKKKQYQDIWLFKKQVKVNFAPGDRTQLKECKTYKKFK